MLSDSQLLTQLFYQTSFWKLDINSLISGNISEQRKSKMKAVVFLGIVCLYTVSAISPFEAIVEEWEVNINISEGLKLHDINYFSSIIRPGRCNMEKCMQETMETPLASKVRRKALG